MSAEELTVVQLDRLQQCMRNYARSQLNGYLSFLVCFCHGHRLAFRRKNEAWCNDRDLHKLGLCYTKTRSTLMRRIDCGMCIFSACLLFVIRRRTACDRRLTSVAQAPRGTAWVGRKVCIVYNCGIVKFEILPN